MAEKQLSGAEVQALKQLHDAEQHLANVREEAALKALEPGPTQPCYLTYDSKKGWSYSWTSHLTGEKYEKGGFETQADAKAAVRPFLSEDAYYLEV